MITHENKVAIVTGSRLGIGRGVANLLAERGATVVLVNRSDSLEIARSIGNGAISIVADVATEAGWQTVADQVGKQFDRCVRDP